MSEENKKVGHVYQIAYDLGNGRQFSVNGNFSQGASGDEMFAEAVKCLDVADRIRARCELELLERELEIRKKALERCKKDLYTIQQKHKKSSTDENQMISIKANIEKIIEDVADGEQNLMNARAKVNGMHVISESASVN